MTTDTGALLIKSRTLESHYRDVESFQQARARLAKRTSVAAIVVAAVLGVANLALAWTVASMLPLTKLVPVYLLIRPDGTIDSSVTLSSLPATSNQAVIRAALWDYVRLREGYAYDSAQYGYDVVSGMSSPTVRARYQSWFNYPNAASPQVTVGRSGNITVAPISVAMLSAHVAQIRFTRTLQMNTSKPVSTTWTATLGFRQTDSLPGSARLSNPGGVIVTNYQSSEDSTP